MENSIGPERVEFSSMQVLEYSIPMAPTGLLVEVLEEEVAVVGW